jgi:hypothetical protein
MLIIAIILFVAYIVSPLFELTLNQSVQRIAKIIVYALVFLWVLYQLFIVSKAV